ALVPVQCRGLATASSLSTCGPSNGRSIGQRAAPEAALLPFNGEPSTTALPSNSRPHSLSVRCTSTPPRLWPTKCTRPASATLAPNFASSPQISAASPCSVG